MKTRLGLGCEFNIARDDRGLSLRLHASQTKSEGSWTFVHSTALAHARVFGMGQTVVKPPTAAAAVPVAIVSLWLCPGSRKCTCRSMNPGDTINQRASSTV